MQPGSELEMVDDPVLDAVVAALRSHDQWRIFDALHGLAIAVANDPANKDGIREAGFIAPLVALLERGGQVGNRVVEALHTLAYNNVENKVAIRRAGGIPPLLRFVLRRRERCYESRLAAVNAAAALRELSCNNENNAVVIALARGNDKFLVHLAWRGRVTIKQCGWTASAGAQRKAKLVVFMLVCKRNWHFKRLDFPAVPHVLNAAIAAYLY